MLRPCNPADLLSLLMWQAKAQPIVACGRHSLASGDGDALPWWGLVQEWFLDNGRRHSWVLSLRGVPAGLVSCRRYKGPGSWEIDRLLVSPGKEWASVDMLEEANLALGRLGAERLVLRLAEGSPLHSCAMEAGFSPLILEKMYVRPPGPPAGPQLDSTEGVPRAGQDRDSIQLFRLYSLSVPASIRQLESLTIGDWEQSSANGDLPPEGRWVLEQDGQVAAALTMVKGNGKRRLLELLTNPKCPADCSHLLAQAEEAEGERSTLMTLLPEYLWTDSIERALDARGFESVAALTVYVKPMTARVRSVGLMPARA